MEETNEQKPQTDQDVPEKEVQISSNSQIKIAGAVLLIILLLVGAFFVFKGQNNSESINTTSQPTATTQPIENASPETSESMVKTINVEAGSFYFKPDQINVKKGDKVKIVLNSVSMTHNFNIDELNVKGALTNSGQSSTVEFTADTAGTFEFYCSVANHRLMGQVGKLIVE